MENMSARINRLLVEVFNDILAIEETEVTADPFRDVSMKEVHTVEAIGLYKELSMSEIAKNLHITLGTLTVAVQHLTAKGYIKRYKSDEDRRVVRIELTERGSLLFHRHNLFHRKMVDEIIEDLDAKETVALDGLLTRLRAFLSAYQPGMEMNE